MGRLSLKIILKVKVIIKNNDLRFSHTIIGLKNPIGLSEPYFVTKRYFFNSSIKIFAPSGLRVSLLFPTLIFSSEISPVI